MLRAIRFIHNYNHWPAKIGWSLVTGIFVVQPVFPAKAHPSQFFRNALILFSQALGAIKYEQYHVCTFGSGPAALHANLLDGVVAWCNTSSINKMKRDTPQISYLLYGITCCSGNRCDNGTLCA